MISLMPSRAFSAAIRFSSTDARPPVRSPAFRALRIQHEPAQTRNRVWRLGHAVVEREKRGGIHRASASERTACNSSRSAVTSASALSRSARGAWSAP